MIKVAGVIVVLLLAGYLVNSYVEKNTRREDQRIKVEQNKQKTQASVKEIATRLNAVTDWDTQLGNGESYRFEQIRTVELEKIWLIDSPILFVGRLQDIKTKDDDNYNVLVERNLLSSLENMFITNLQLSLVAPKNKIDAFLKLHPDLFKGVGLDKDIAVVANIDSIETIYVSGEECGREEIKVGYGEMLDLEFVGLVRL